MSYRRRLSMSRASYILLAAAACLGGGIAGYYLRDTQAVFAGSVSASATPSATATALDGPVGLRSFSNGFASTPRAAPIDPKQELRLGWLHSWSEPSATIYQCKDIAASPRGSRRKTCQFTQVTAHHPSKLSEAANFDAALAKWPERTQDLEKVIQGEVRQLCKNPLPGPRPPSFASADAEWLKFCENPNLESYKKVLATEDAIRNQSCEISMNPYEVTYEEVDRNTWKSEHNAYSGTDFCGRRTDGMFIRSSFTWKYRQVRVPVRKPDPGLCSSDDMSKSGKTIELEGTSQGYWWGCDTFYFVPGP